MTATIYLSFSKRFREILKKIIEMMDTVEVIEVFAVADEEEMISAFVMQKQQVQVVKINESVDAQGDVSIYVLSEDIPISHMKFIVHQSWLQQETNQNAVLGGSEPKEKFAILTVVGDDIVIPHEWRD